LRGSPSNGPKTTSVNQQGGELVTLEIQGTVWLSSNEGLGELWDGKTAEEANAVAKQVRLEINGEFDVSRRPKMFSDGEPGKEDLATVIDTDKSVLGRWYCPRVGRLFVCKQFAQHDDGREPGVYAHGKSYQVCIEGTYFGTYASAAEANAVVHKVWDERYGDNGKVDSLRRDQQH
jgi:hypothetical protein